MSNCQKDVKCQKIKILDYGVGSQKIHAYIHVSDLAVDVFREFTECIHRISVYLPGDKCIVHIFCLKLVMIGGIY